jgi:HEAT repeat protein
VSAQPYNFGVAQPSKAGAVFAFLFGLPFFGLGLFFAFAMLSSSPAIHKSGNPIAGASFGLVFALVGAGLMFGAVYGYHRLKQDQATKEANANAPWLWRTDWATSKSSSLTRNSAIGWWIGTILASMIVVPVVTTALPPLLHNSDPKALILIGLCLFPAILLVGALRATIRRERFGKTYFEFSSLPFSPGKHVTGQIQLRLGTSAEHGIDLRLSCIRRIVTGSGKEQTTNEIVLWQEEKNVPQTALSVGPIGTAIPVDFGIPQDAYETNHDQDRDQLLWVLTAKADVPGVDYSDKFEVPVFRTSGSAASPADANFTASGFASSFGSAAGTAPAFESDSSEVSAPVNPKVVVSTTNDGSTDFFFPPFRNRGQTFGLLLFAAVWTGVVFFLLHSRAPWFFAAVFGFFDLLLIYGFFQSAFGSTRIVVGQGKISSRRNMLGAGTPRDVPFSDVQAIVVTAGIQSTNASNGSYRVRLQTKGGKDFSLADNISDRQEARWIVCQIEKLVGLKTDTHVALQDSFGHDYSRPPQREVSETTVPRNVVRPNKVAGVLGMVGFMLWTGFVFYKVVGAQHGMKRQSNSVTAKASPAKRTVHVAYSPLTDEDVQRIQQLPVQNQAEELLERSIEHDARALDLFEQNIESPEWLGKIRLTDRMKELERRSEFSRDLRVRYANADLNLSMDGWQRNDEGADKLIERARDDAQYRATAVYFMGMMAGRGIAYDRVYPALLEYAKHDPDAGVRVWAVEGMRYLGTDEALDQLFDSFENDPSNQVRDRAGCNVSDCGNFKRAQRMRMVPYFISLTQDPNTTPQMRNWSFLALHEITDENLPNDATVWQNWYEQHGSEKLVQFEQASWWQVRGDE